MKRTNWVHLFCITVWLFFVQCSSTIDSKNLEIIGTISDAANLTLELATLEKNNQSKVIGKTEIDSEGSFHLRLEEKPEAGAYKIVVGKKIGQLLLTGNESKVEINGSLSDLAQYKYQVTGAPATEELLTALDDIRSQRMTLDSLQRFAVNSNYPIAGLSTTYISTRGNPQMIQLIEKAFDRVEKKYGVSNTSVMFYQQLISNIKKKAQGPVGVGEMAPDIRMEDPSGKEYALSDLRGKVVLLDFWASWCRPCRKANPHVVEIYNKYKDQGFTVFSVSLDGLDQRTKNRLNNDEGRIQSYLEQSKKRWIQAIKTDGLVWDYHVSDLKKWNSEAAALYGVSSIPRTFLIDREGKIAAINPRYNLEEELRKLLQ